MQEHANGMGGKFTKAYKPFKLVYQEEFETVEQAFHRERQLHGWSHAKKRALIDGDFDKLKDLSKSKDILHRPTSNKCSQRAKTPSAIHFRNGMRTDRAARAMGTFAYGTKVVAYLWPSRGF